VPFVRYGVCTSHMSRAKPRRLDNASDQRKVVAREVAVQRMWGQKRRRRRVLPRQIVPKAIAVEYTRALQILFRVAREAYRPLLEALARTQRTDADDDRYKVGSGYKSPKLLTTVGGRGYTPIKVTKSFTLPSREVKRLLDDAEKRLETTVSVGQVESLASKFATRTTTYQRMQLGRQVRSALGADPFMRDSVLAGVTEDFVAQNVSLIKRIPSRLHEKIEGMVMNSVGKGQLNINLGEEIQKQFGVAERHAKLIARDQLAKYYGAVNKARQQELGLTKFIWRTVNDERVRDSHEALEGQTFSWDDLPTNERGEEIYPGSDYQCRCSAEPVMDDLLDEVDEAEAGFQQPSFEDLENEEIDTDEEQE
jgi:SPP1 gp7 family putative phage head morphogenesis protein